MTQSSYQVIARRWRPTQFSELVGQDHIVRTLGNAIKLDRIAHAYLFVGPRGTGKTTSARLFAKSLNWEQGPTLDVPDDSEIGKAIMDGRCLDVIEIDGASNNSVDQVRDLRDECQYAPSQCRFKIYVIDEVHMLSQAAFNALLKTLEEPPPHVKFIFATTESNKVLPTIISRCQRFEFRSIAVELIVSKLVQICETEKIDVEKEALHAIARMAQGGMRDAQSILDQMISFCGKKISQSDVLEVYGLISHERIVRLCGLIIEGDYSQILLETDAYAKEGIDFYRALTDLSEYARQLLMDSVNKAEAVYPEQIVRILDALKAGEPLVRNGLSEKTNFEVTILRAVEAGKSRPIDKVIRQISNLLPEVAEKKKHNKNSLSQADLLSSDKDVSTGGVGPSKVSYQAVNDHDELLLDESSPLKEKPKIEDVTASSLAAQSDEGADSKTFSMGEKEIEELKKRSNDLPDEIRDILRNKFRAEFVAVEDIDRNILI